MRNWLMLSLSLHFLLILSIALLPARANNIAKKKKQVFYVDFVGKSIIKTAGPRGNKKEGIALAKPLASKSKEEKKESIAKAKANIAKSEIKEKLRLPLDISNTKKLRPKESDISNYLEAEDFAAGLPPPSMAAMSGVLPKRKSAQTISGRTSSGIGGGSLRTDTDFPYPWFIAQVRQALYNCWTENSPSVAGLFCIIKFTIQRNGNIKWLRTEKSSGNRLFDSAAIAAVRAAAPFSRLPDDFYEDTITIHVEFRSIE